MATVKAKPGVPMTDQMLLWNLVTSAKDLHLYF
jgi:hypothetical protein